MLTRICAPSARILPDSCVPLNFATLRRVLPASLDSDLTPGTNSLARLAPLSFTPFMRFVQAAATPSRPRATSCSTFEPNASTSALSWRLRSWTAIGDAVSVADEVHGFRYFEIATSWVRRWHRKSARRRAREAAIVGDEDPAFAGGSYVIVQKYLHNMKAWNALSD